MKQVIETIEQLKTLSGNAQLDYLNQQKTDLLKDILEYTYNPHKKYKIEEGKYDKIQLNTNAIKDPITIETWNKFKLILDELSNIKSAKDEYVLKVKTFIQSSEAAYFLKQILFKDLRLNMGIKKFQKIWPGFCEQPQVQLACKWEGQFFQNGFYSRKLDGLRNYTLDGICYSRSNKLHKPAPLQHISDQIKELGIKYVFDGELIYLNEDGSEDFQKAISLIHSDKRNKLCDNIYFIIFDMIDKEKFLNKEVALTKFCDEYKNLKQLLEIKEEKLSWFTTKFPNILLIKQVTEDKAEELRHYSQEYNWEGLMYRDGNAPYEYKRSKSLLKIKAMQDIELKILDMEKGVGKHSGRLGAFLVDFKGNIVKVGYGFSDEQREEYWNNYNKYKGKYAKVQYFEETTNIDGKPSLRFPVFLCFRDEDTKEEYITIN